MKQNLSFFFEKKKKVKKGYYFQSAHFNRQMG